MAGEDGLRTFVRRAIENHFGCPVEDITQPEKVAWANRNTETKTEFDAVLEAIR